MQSLSQRLNELAIAHKDNRITDEEYRILRQNAFEADLNTAPTTAQTAAPASVAKSPQPPTTTPNKQAKSGFLPRLGKKASSLFSSTSPKPPSLNRPSIPSFPPPKQPRSPKPDTESDDLPTSTQIRQLLSSTISESERIISHFEHLGDKARRENEQKNARRLVAKTPGDVGEVFAAGWRDYSPAKSPTTAQHLTHSRSSSSLQHTPTPRYSISPSSPLSPTRSSARPPPSPISITHHGPPPPSPSKSSTSSLLRKASLSSISKDGHTLKTHRSSGKLSVDRSSRASSSKSRESTGDEPTPAAGRKRSLSSSKSTSNLNPNYNLLSTSPVGSSSSFSHRSQSPRVASHSSSSRGDLGVLTEGQGEEDEDEEVRELRRKKEDVQKRYKERIEYLKAQLKSAELREKARK